MVLSKEVSPKELQKRQSPDGGTGTTQQTRGSGGDASQQKGIPPSNTPGKPLENTGGRILQLDKEGSVSSLAPRKLSHAPGSDLHSLQSSQEGWSPSITREKVSEDGYRWRKYGQKLVKGNEFIRSYYKCTHPSCQVKKQLECSHDGKLVDIVYIGEHEHPKPQLNLPQAVGCVLSLVEEKPDNLLLTGIEESQAPNPIESTTTSQICTVTSGEDVKRVLSEPNRIRDEVDDYQRSKQRKRGSCNDDSTPVDKPTSEPRLVIKKKYEVDTVNDGYRWRKYGQKLVKGSPNPRSYYRCSSPRCPVKKHVERAYNDPKSVITSYVGQHDHDMPPSRTVTHNTTGFNTTTTIQDGESGAKSGESDAISLDMVAYNSSDSNIKSEERMNSELRNKWKESISGHESETREQQNGKSSATKAKDIVVNANPVSAAGRLTEQHDGESRIESKEKSAVRAITQGPKSNPNEQHMLNSDPVQS